jgi:hypothetical protein
MPQPGSGTADTALVVAYASAVIVALVWVCVRAWRMQLRIDEHGVKVRNFLPDLPDRLA